MLIMCVAVVAHVIVNGVASAGVVESGFNDEKII